MRCTSGAVLLAWAALSGATLQEDAWAACKERTHTNPEQLWCYEAGSGLREVQLRKECSDAATQVYCPRYPCSSLRNVPCLLAQHNILVDKLHVHENDEVRLCGCLGPYFSIRDVNGFKRCLHTAESGNPFTYTFDLETNTMTYKYVTCYQLAECLEISLFNGMKYWRDVSAVSECDDYVTCVQEMYMGMWTSCVRLNNLNLRDKDGNACTAHQTQSACKPYRTAVNCNECAAKGAISDTDQMPPKQICALQHKPTLTEQCVEYPTSTPEAQSQEQCEGTNGEWCPHLAERVLNYSAKGSVTYSKNPHEACRDAEEFKSGELLCAREETVGTFTASVVATEKGCDLSKGARFCPKVACESSLSCERAFANVSSEFISQSMKDVQDLCDCLGSEYELMQRNGAFTCVHKQEGLQWNTNEWDLSTATRKFKVVNCSLLAHCEPKYAYDRVMYAKRLPNECDDVKKCSEDRELGEAIACADETFFDMTGAQCPDTERLSYCKAEMTSILCYECANQIGLDPTKRTCTSRTRGNCFSVNEAKDCATNTLYYCPSLLTPPKLTANQLCLVCETTRITDPPLCCADVASDKPFHVSQPSECPAPSLSLCAGVQCPLSSTCSSAAAAGAPAHLAKEVQSICECLGFKHNTSGCFSASGKRFDATEGVPPTFEVDGEEVRYTELTCDLIAKCFPSNTDTLAKIRALRDTPSCTTEQTCLQVRERQREKMCARVKLFGGAEECPAAAKDAYCTQGLSRLLCEGCLNGKSFQEDSMCAQPDGTCTAQMASASKCLTIYKPGSTYCPTLQHYVPAPGTPSPVAPADCPISPQCHPAADLIADVSAKEREAICKCLGGEFVFQVETNLCVRASTGKPYDNIEGSAPLYKLPDEKVQFTEMTCVDLQLCATANLPQIEVLRLMPRTCPDAKCLYTEAARRGDYCLQSMHFHDREDVVCQMNAPGLSRFCSVGMEKVVCSRCMGPGESFTTHDVCAHGEGVCTEYSTPQLCAGMGGVFCPAVVESVPAAPHAAHQPIPAPSGSSSGAKWTLVVIFAVGLGLCGMAFCVLMRRQDDSTEDAYSNADEMQQRRYTPPSHW